MSDTRHWMWSGCSRQVCLVMVLSAALAVLYFGGGSLRRAGDGPDPLVRVFDNLRAIQGAKEQWAMDRHQTNGALPMPADLTPYLKNGVFIRPVGEETYTINPVGVSPLVVFNRKSRISPPESAFSLTNGSLVIRVR